MSGMLRGGSFRAVRPCGVELLEGDGVQEAGCSCVEARRVPAVSVVAVKGEVGDLVGGDDATCVGEIVPAQSDPGVCLSGLGEVVDVGSDLASEQVRGEAGVEPGDVLGAA